MGDRQPRVLLWLGLARSPGLRPGSQRETVKTAQPGSTLGAGVAVAILVMQQAMVRCCQGLRCGWTGQMGIAARLPPGNDAKFSGF